MAIAPSQPVDHTPILILEDDDAWDRERFVYELDVLAGKDPDERGRPPYNSHEEHPLLRYFRGQTRFHLDDEVSSYLLPDRTPLRFTLRRLDEHQWRMVERRDEEGNRSDARYVALRYGLDKVEGAALEVRSGHPVERPVEIKLRSGDDGPITEGALTKLRNLLGDDNLRILGAACKNASRRLLDHEKKR
jgi:hypothetical protein